MKVCWMCATDIDTEDGQNLCAECERDRRKADDAKERRRKRERVLCALGMVKVTRPLGGVFWERTA